MKYLLHLSILTIGLFFTACQGNAQQPAKPTATAGTHIDVIEFHTEHRCATCLTMERLSREVLETTFAAQYKAGTITFRTVNVEEKANAAIAEEYGAYGTSLYLSVVKNGKAEKVDLTEWAFLNANDEAKFKTELAQRLREKL